MDDKHAKIRESIKNIKSLPTLPGIVAKLNVLMEDKSVPVEEIARLISTDQILAAKVLKLVNSASYGFPRRVSTVSHAIILLGVNVVKSLVLSASIFEMMEKHVLGLWEHSLGAGIAANVIAKRLGLADPEEITTAALLHDIGKVIIKIELGDDYEHLATIVGQRDISMREAEREFLDTDHTEIGELLGKAWLLPEKLIEPIACHHDVARAAKQPVRTAAVHLANALVKAGGFGFGGDDIVPIIQPAAWKVLGLTDAHLEAIVEEMEDKLVDARNFSLEVQASDAVQT